MPLFEACEGMKSHKAAQEDSSESKVFLNPMRY